MILKSRVLIVTLVLALSSVTIAAAYAGSPGVANINKDTQALIDTINNLAAQINSHIDASSAAPQNSLVIDQQIGVYQGPTSLVFLPEKAGVTYSGHICLAAQAAWSFDNSGSIALYSDEGGVTVEVGRISSTSQSLSIDFWCTSLRIVVYPAPGLTVHLSGLVLYQNCTNVATLKGGLHG